jgi:hypothetical protein
MRVSMLDPRPKILMVTAPPLFFDGGSFTIQAGKLALAAVDNGTQGLQIGLLAFRGLGNVFSVTREPLY